MEKRSLLLGVLLGIIGGFFSSLMSGSFLVIIQLQETSKISIIIFIFLIFLDSFLGLVLFMKWIGGLVKNSP